MPGAAGGLNGVWEVSLGVCRGVIHSILLDLLEEQVHHRATHSHHLSSSVLLSADEPTFPKKPKGIPEPQPCDMQEEVTSPLPSEWTSVRISPGEDTVGQDVLAVRVLVTSDDSRYAQTAQAAGGTDSTG